MAANYQAGQPLDVSARTGPGPVGRGTPAVEGLVRARNSKIRKQEEFSQLFNFRGVLHF